MGISEMSNLFDLLYNNITSNQAPGLNEYEKSVFLTKAEYEILKNHSNANSTGNTTKEGFDGSMKRQADFSTLILSSTLINIVNDNRIDRRKGTLSYEWPLDAFIVLDEQMYVGESSYTVVPIAYDEYSRLMSKPYKYPHKNQAWRLISNNISGYLTQVKQEYKIGSNSYVLNTYSTNDKPVKFTIKAGRHEDPIVDYDLNKTPIEFQINIPKQMGGTTFSSIWEVFDAVATASPTSIELVGSVLNSAVWNTSSHNSSQIPNIPIDEDNSDWVNRGILFDILLPGKSTKVIPLVEIIGKFSSTPTYTVRYVKKPTPIVLVDLTDEELSIEGYTTPTPCELPEELHEEIVQRAVELAKIAWTSTGQDNTQAVIQAGQRSE